MKAEWRVFGFVGAFLVVATTAYWFLSRDPTGTTALSLATGLASLIGSYLWATSRRLAGPRPEDRSDGEIEDGAGELGFFSPHSWWPLVAAAAAALTCLGVIFGWWLAIIGVAFLLYGVLGYMFEYYKSGPSHHDRVVS